MSLSPPVSRTLDAAWLVLAAWLALAAPWLVFGTGCQPDPTDRPAPQTSQGEEILGIGVPESEASAQSADLTKPIDTNNPEERTPTVTAPPALPPQPAESVSGGSGGSGGGGGIGAFGGGGASGAHP